MYFACRLSAPVLATLSFNLRSFRATSCGSTPTWCFHGVPGVEVPEPAEEDEYQWWFKFEPVGGVKSIAELDWVCCPRPGRESITDGAIRLEILFWFLICRMVRTSIPVSPETLALAALRFSVTRI
jgi:hypothetical protein